jgi:signal transduction histidine kinase
MTLLAALGWLSAVSLALLALTTRRRLERVRRAEHEIRGPLAALGLAAEQVRRGRAGREIAGTLEAQLDRARAGVEDLGAALEGRRSGARLALASGSSRGPGRGDPLRRPTGSVALERLARHTAAGWEGVAARGGGRLRFDWRAGPVTVAADRGRLAQALGNLIANAIEHGGGDVELRGERAGGGVRVEVADSGAAGHRIRAGGRPGAAQPLGPAGVRAVPPRGRGLAIASRAVEESGGRLEVRMDAAGTTAALELPVAEP